MESYDYVIVGAGSAGCVLANRLSAEPGVRVLLLEAGGSDRKMNIRIPVGFAKQFRTDLDWNYTSEPESSLIGRSMYLPRGRSLGGSSSMNAMIYMRGNRGDFDGWAENGAPGWSYREVLPYFKRSEHNERIHNEYHGQGGELIASSGAYNSPQLLMLSGIGPADHLRELGIEPVVDNPHVGSHLMDHPLATITYECREPVGLFDATNPKYLVQYVAGRGKGKLSSNVAEAGAHVRVAPDTPWPDFQVLFRAAYDFDNGFRSYPGHAFTCGPSFVRPTSEGDVRRRSADPSDPPVIRLGWFQDPAEMRAMIDSVRLAREIAESGPLARASIRNLDPGPGVRSDAQVEAWLRAELQHLYHPSCTCRMAGEDDGVLDEELRVRGVEGLRVVDASSMPRITSGNTNAPTIMIAERCADLVLGRELLQPAEVREPEPVTATT